MAGKKKGLIIFIMIMIAALYFSFKAFDPRINTVYYEDQNEKIQEEIKIVFISDLHGTEFGNHQKNLLRRLEKEKPDLLLLGGDIFDDRDGFENSKEFLEQINGKYNSYFITGNHEYNSGRIKEILEITRANNIKILAGETTALDMKGTKIDLSGTDDRNFREEIFKTQLERASEEKREDAYSILLTHRIINTEEFQKYNYNLVLSGHSHGGQVRLPYLLNGVYTREEGFLPMYAGGVYQNDQTKYIVGRGLTRKTYKIDEKYPIPRIFNPPELVVIKLLPLN